MCVYIKYLIYIKNTRPNTIHESFDEELMGSKMPAGNNLKKTNTLLKKCN